MSYISSCYTNEGTVIPSHLSVKLDKRDTKFVNTSEGEKEILNFSGIIIQNGAILVSFPKHYKFSKNDIEEDIRLLFDTIKKHYNDNQKLYFNKSINLKTNYPFNAFFNIYSYYQKYGIYHEEEIETISGYNGKISWKDTIRSSSKIVSKSGILFLPLKVKRVKKRRVLIGECMAYAIDYTIRLFSLFLNLPRVGGNSLQKNFVENKNFILRELYSSKNEVFKDIHKKLIMDLIDFYERLPGGGTYYLKHYTFSSVWEKVVENYLNHYFTGIESGKLIFDEKSNQRNHFHKETFYPNEANMEQNIQPDHYFVKEGNQYIFDAKYYNGLTGINYKQVAYHFFLKNYSDKGPEYNVKKYKRTYTALILPGNKEQKIHFSLKPQYNSKESDFVIYEYYLNCKVGMEAYLRNSRR